MKVVYTPTCLSYKIPGHPESPQRIDRIYHSLKSIPSISFYQPNKATEQEILSVHDKTLLNAVKNSTYIDPDTPVIPGIFEISVLAAGATIKASEIAQKEGSSYALVRPPGHHATRKMVGGFCYLNNLAIAVKKLLENNKRVAILDIDVHHGNGTQDIFLGEKSVQYFSLHQVPLYPGTGWKSEGNCRNFPLPAGTNGDQYIEVLQKAFADIEKFSPDILAVSLGFDTYESDPLAQLKLKKEDYKKIGVLIKNLNFPTFFVQEGGYSRDIGELAFQFFTGFLSLSPIES